MAVLNQKIYLKIQDFSSKERETIELSKVDISELKISNLNYKDYK